MKLLFLYQSCGMWNHYISKNNELGKELIWKLENKYCIFSLIVKIGYDNNSKNHMKMISNDNDDHIFMN